jgi:hypothetical protein
MEPPLAPPPSIEKPEQKNNSTALAAGACGIGSIVAQLLGSGLAAIDPSIAGICNGIGGIAWLAGIILGIIGLIQISRNPGQKGKGWAIAGIGIGILRICIIVVMTLSLIPINPFVGQISTKISSTLTAP